MPPRPKTRAACAKAQRPCPYVGCRHHLYMDVSKTGKLQCWSGEEQLPENVETLARMPQTCALDLADQQPEGMEQKDIARIMAISEQRVGQLLHRALRKMALAYEATGWTREPVSKDGAAA